MGSAKAVISRKLPTPPARRKCLPWLGWPMLHGKDQLQEQEKVSRRKNGSRKTSRKGRWCRRRPLPSLDLTEIFVAREESAVCSLAQDWIELLWMENGKYSRKQSGRAAAVSPPRLLQQATCVSS